MKVLFLILTAIVVYILIGVLFTILTHNQMSGEAVPVIYPLLWPTFFLTLLH